MVAPRSPVLPPVPLFSTRSVLPASRRLGVRPSLACSAPCRRRRSWSRGGQGVGPAPGLHPHVPTSVLSPVLRPAALGPGPAVRELNAVGAACDDDPRRALPGDDPRAPAPVGPSAGRAEVDVVLRVEVPRRPGGLVGPLDARDGHGRRLPLVQSAALQGDEQQRTPGEQEDPGCRPASALDQPRRPRVTTHGVLLRCQEHSATREPARRQLDDPMPNRLRRRPSGRRSQRIRTTDCGLRTTELE